MQPDLTCTMGGETKSPFIGKLRTQNSELGTGCFGSMLTKPGEHYE
jgi:hypothetical protein